MSTVAQTPRVAPRGRQRAARRPVTGGILWIVVLTGLLAGVVAVNVFVLRLNIELDQLGRERAELKAEIAGVRAQLSSASAGARIESEAASRLGLAPADPALTEYVRLGAK